MPKPYQQSFPKWPITVPVLFLLLLLMMVTLPVTLLFALLLTLLPNYRGTVRTLLFFLCYLVCEVVGVVASAWITLRYSSTSENFQAANFKLQCWWASSLWKSARRIFSLSELFRRTRRHRQCRGDRWRCKFVERGTIEPRSSALPRGHALLTAKTRGAANKGRRQRRVNGAA